jgi:hypothetical protein
VALGWGLWEGPARFYFWPLSIPRNLSSIKQLRFQWLTFNLKGIT